MHQYKLPSTNYTVPSSPAQRTEIAQVLGKWASLEPCQFSCGGKIVRSGECSNHCPPSREMLTGASEAFADLSGFSEAYPIQDQRIYSQSVRRLQLVVKKAFKIA